MAELRVENVKLTDDFATLLGGLGVPGPWEADAEEIGIIRARDGQYVCTVDTWRDLPDSVVRDRAMAIILAVNTCAGFKAVARG